MTKNKINLIWCCGYKKLVAKNLTRKRKGSRFRVEMNKVIKGLCI